MALAAAALVAACSEPTVVYVTPAPSSGGINIGPGTSTAPASQAPASQAPTGSATQAQMVAATVQIFSYDTETDDLERWSSAGSGTILTKDGYILTNAHVGAPDAEGLAVQYGEPTSPTAKLIVALNVSEDKVPVKTYHASLVAVDGYLDVAVIKIDAMADGSPVDAASLNLPTLPIGDSDAMHIGDQITIVGFPGIGGDTVTVDKGDVSGFIGDDRIGDRAWIKTSAIVYHGNSGGLAANASGQLVAIPTRLPDFGNGQDVGGFSLLRPVNLAKPVIDAALSGQTYMTSKYVKSGTGQEAMQAIGWLDPADDGCTSADPYRALPVGVQRLAAAFRYEGFTDGEDVLQVWLVQKSGKWTVITKKSDLWEGGPSGECYVASVSYADGFPENTYAVALLVGPKLQEAAETNITTGAAPPPTPEPTPQPSQNNGGTTGEQLLVTGRMVSTTTGKPIAGVSIFVLKQGLDPNAWVENPTEDALFGYAESAKDGTFTILPTLEKGAAYPVVIAAKGYQPLIGTLTVNGEKLGDVGLTPR